jgi:hypothetical protein
MVLAAERTDVTRAKPRYAVIDCDIHPNLASANALDPYLSERWREYRSTVGGRGSGSSQVSICHSLTALAWAALHSRLRRPPEPSSGWRTPKSMS